jgi:hypothetical protein
MKKQTLWFLLGASAILGIAAVAPQGGGSSGVPVSNGSATNLSVYSSGTTNRPLRVFSTNGLSESYFDRDAKLVLQRTNNAFTPGIMLSTGEDSYSNPTIQVLKADGTAGAGTFLGQYVSIGGGAGVSGGLIAFFNGNFGAGWTLGNSYGFGWNANPSGSASTMNSVDTQLRRLSAGVVEVVNGTSGVYRDLVTRSSFTTNLYATNITAQGYLTTQQTLAYASGTNVTVDASKSLHFVSLTNTSYFAQPSSLAVGSSFTVILKQDGTGGRAVTFNTNYWKFPGGVQPSITTNANAYSVLSCIADPYGTNVFSVSTLDIK